MKTQIESQYKMATIATHISGDISRAKPDICIVCEEDGENYYGRWVTGFGFVNVAFPKATTRDLIAEEIAEYHGRPTMIGGMLGPTINITGEDFGKHVVVTKEGGGKVHAGNLVAPIHVGRNIAMITDEGTSWCTSEIQSVTGDKGSIVKCIRVKTLNSTYQVQYL